MPDLVAALDTLDFLFDLEVDASRAPAGEGDGS